MNNYKPFCRDTAYDTIGCVKILEAWKSFFYCRFGFGSPSSLPDKVFRSKLVNELCRHKFRYYPRKLCKDGARFIHCIIIKRMCLSILIRKAPYPTQKNFGFICVRTGTKLCDWLVSGRFTDVNVCF